MPEWLFDFLSGPTIKIAAAIWNSSMKLIIKLVCSTPQKFSTGTWAFVKENLYPWAEGIGLSALNLFFMIAFLKAVSNLHQNITLEMVIEAMIKVVVANVLYLNILNIMTTIFSISSAMAKEVFTIDAPDLKVEDKKAGSYTPQAGDIIYFDKGGVGESHHVGIVEYVENGIVHTIEGNKNSQVMRGHYELTYKGIMGYGTPDYPDEGLTSSTASEILSKAQELGKMMVEEKWVYSNTDLKGSLAAAEQSAKRTNCAHGVCLVLQEIGLLKKGQIFFGNKSGELSCNGTVRKQIEKGFDIIKTGGKKSKDLDLKPGDICLFKGHTNIYAGKDENGKTYWYDFGRDQTKDKKPGSVFVKSVRKGEINWAVITVILRVKDQDGYGSGKTINIPSPYGDSFTYMGWSLITATGSNQYKLRVKTGEHYDANGFGKIGDRYVIACTPTFGKIGDEIDFVLANGRVIHGVMGDEKNMSDAGCNKWGHDNGHSVVEFVVNKSMWYHTGKTVTKFHPEWAKSRVVKAINLGKNHLK